MLIKPFSVPFFAPAHEPCTSVIEPFDIGGLIDGRKFGKVAVLMGGRSAERDISLLSGAGVLNALRAVGVDAHAFDPAESDIWQLQSNSFERCFIALHGRFGEDGTVQGALELMGIPYTGSGVMASAVAMDKVMTKRVWAAEQLSTPKHVLLRRAEQTQSNVDAVVQELGLPLIVKPSREGSSIGLCKVTESSVALEAVRSAASFDPDVLCESFINGDEVTCAVLGEGSTARALPVIRIAPPETGFDYHNKYFANEVKYHCPSGLRTNLEQSIQSLVVAAYRSLGCRGWGRADLIIRRSDQKPMLLEMNTSPGMTTHSLVPMAAQAVGLSYERLCLYLLSQATLDTYKSRE